MAQTLVDLRRRLDDLDDGLLMSRADKRGVELLRQEVRELARHDGWFIPLNGGRASRGLTRLHEISEEAYELRHRACDPDALNPDDPSNDSRYARSLHARIDFLDTLQKSEADVARLELLWQDLRELEMDAGWFTCRDGLHSRGIARLHEINDALSEIRYRARDLDDEGGGVAHDDDDDDDDDDGGGGGAPAGRARRDDSTRPGSHDCSCSRTCASRGPTGPSRMESSCRTM